MRLISFFLVLYTAVPLATASPATIEGRYQHSWAPNFTETSENFLTIRRNGARLSGIYAGEANLGEHGSAFFRVSLKDLTVEGDGTIHFSLPPYEMYPAPERDGKRQKKFGGTNPDARFRGVMQGEDILLTCRSKYGDCPENTVFFKKIK
jgi:hypothetical protein